MKRATSSRTLPHAIMHGMPPSCWLPCTVAKTLLGTATPSLESYYHARNGKYGLVELTERHQQIQLPHIELVDIKELARKKRMTAQFSPLLLQQNTGSTGAERTGHLIPEPTGVLPR